MMDMVEPGGSRFEAMLVDVGRVTDELWRLGWAERNAGNVSVDLTDIFDQEDATSHGKVILETPFPSLAGRTILVTGTGSRLRYVSRDPCGTCCVVVVDDVGASYDIVWGCSDVRPTSEFPSHLRVHDHLRKARPSYRAVLHTHPTRLITLTHDPSLLKEGALNTLLQRMHPEVRIVYPDGIGVAPYRVPGTDVLGVATVEQLTQHRIVLWEKHGSVSVGATVDDAFDLLVTMDKSAEIYLLARQAGIEPEGLGPERLLELDAAFPDYGKD